MCKPFFFLLVDSFWVPLAGVVFAAVVELLSAAAGAGCVAGAVS